MDQPKEPLRILIADGDAARLQDVGRAISSLGHEVIQETGVGQIGRVTAREHPDAALVVLGQSSGEALQLIGRIVHEAACPVIAVLDVEDPQFVEEAAKRGIFAYVTSGGQDVRSFESSLDIVLRRFAEYHALEGAFGRRAVTERAKGILMERHGVDEQEAFNLMREQARRNNRKVVDVAESVLASHRLLPSQPAKERSGGRHPKEGTG